MKQEEARGIGGELREWNRVKEMDYGRGWDLSDSRSQITQGFISHIKFGFPIVWDGDPLEGLWSRRVAGYFSKRIILNLAWRLDCEYSRVELKETRRDAIADTGNIWILYMGRDTGWEQGSSHTGGDLIWDILWRERWQDVLMDWMKNMRREESRMTGKFWPVQLGGQNCQVLRWSSLAEEQVHE